VHGDNIDPDPMPAIAKSLVSYVSSLANVMK
jgi:hypothetical protein